MLVVAMHQSFNLIKTNPGNGTHPIQLELFGSWHLIFGDVSWASVHGVSRRWPNHFSWQCRIFCSMEVTISLSVTAERVKIFAFARLRFSQLSFRWPQLGGMDIHVTDPLWNLNCIPWQIKTSATRQKTNILTSYTAQKSFNIPIKISSVFHYKNWREMPYLYHYHKQFLISTFHVGNIHYFNTSRTALLSDLFFMSECPY